MPKSFASVVIDADPAAVWQVVRNFNGTPDYLDAVATSEILDGKPADQVGCQRHIVLTDGSVVEETLIGIDDETRTLRYHLTASPFPFTGYYSTMRVSLVSENGASYVDWSSVYDCQEADAAAMDDLLAGQLYGPGLASIKKSLTSAG